MRYVLISIESASCFSMIKYNFFHLYQEVYNLPAGNIFFKSNNVKVYRIEGCKEISSISSKKSILYPELDLQHTMFCSRGDKRV